MRAWLAALSIAALAVLAGPAAAQQPAASGSGRLSAQASGEPLPTGATVELSPGASDNLYGQDPLYSAARGALRDALTSHGFRVGAAHALRLSFTVSSVGYATRTPPSLGHPGSQQGPAPRATVTDQFRVPFAAPSAGAPPSLTVAMILYAPEGAVLWSATIRATGQFPEPDRVVALLARTAMGALGTSAERSFEVGCESRAPDRLCID